MIKDIAIVCYHLVDKNLKSTFKSLSSWTARSVDGSETKPCTTLHKSLASNTQPITQPSILLTQRRSYSRRTPIVNVLNYAYSWAIRLKNSMFISQSQTHSAWALAIRQQDTAEVKSKQKICIRSAR